MNSTPESLVGWANKNRKRETTTASGHGPSLPVDMCTPRQCWQEVHECINAGKGNMLSSKAPLVDAGGPQHANVCQLVRAFGDGKRLKHPMYCRTCIRA